MNVKRIASLLSSVKVAADHPLFYSRVFSFVARKQKLPVSPYAFLLDDFEEMSRHAERSGLQEGAALRHAARIKEIVHLLMDEQGIFSVVHLKGMVQFLEAHLYSIGPGREEDAIRQEHLLRVLKRMERRPDLLQMVQKISRPLFNPQAEQIIRFTLHIPQGIPLTDAHTKKAALTAWLSYLRQNVGSCFATAPALLIHQEQQELFLQDLIDLLSTGKLKRTFEGNEISIPLSRSFGSGELKKPLVLSIDEEKSTPEIWYSPAFVFIFEQLGFFPDLSLKEKIENLKQRFFTFIRSISLPSKWGTNAEEILKFLLLQHFELSVKEYEDYGKEKEEGFPGIALHPSLGKISTQEKTERKRLRECKKAFELAKHLFVSLTDNPFLKSWEYTLASFSEAKFEFTKWNLFSGLGLKPEEAGGIGECIYHTLQYKFEQVNQKIQDIRYEDETLYTQVKILESRMKHASTEEELKWIKMEYQSRANEWHSIREQYEELKEKGNALQSLYDTLYRLYVHLFSDYFQEVYDADMQDVSTGIFDDSPAGFRLLYKHGRTQSSQWTLVQNAEEYIDVLVAFFTATESQILQELEKARIERDLNDVVTAIINHIKTKEFLESSLYRMAAMHRIALIKNPLDHLEQVEKKPWVYTSGGKMTTLLSCYFKFSREPTVLEKWVENEMELLVYIADTLKGIPSPLLAPYKEKKKESLLMQSPTHAFRLQPYLFSFEKVWENEAFTYTFIRDQFVLPAEIFVNHLLLNDEMIGWLIEELAEKVPENFRPRFKGLVKEIKGPLTSLLFREALVDLLHQDRGLMQRGGPVLAIDEIDSLLYSSLPFTPKDRVKQRLGEIFSLLPHVSLEDKRLALQIYEEHAGRFWGSIVSAAHLQKICKALLCLLKRACFFSWNIHEEIVAAVQKLGYAMPRPIIFADTNWPKYFFAFVVNPGSGKLELWRVNRYGSEGFPMSIWKEWVNGSRSDIKWGIYVKPYEYEMERKKV